MNLRKLTDRAKQLVDERGGTEGLKQEAAHLRDIAKGQGSVADKAKAAAKAVRDPGTHKPPASGAGEGEGAAPAGGASSTASSDASAEGAPAAERESTATPLHRNDPPPPDQAA